jgi:DNA polymerase-3 subunit alpha
MKEEFIKRHRFPEHRKDAHPILLEIMPDTYGVMVYQEDVMKVASQFADLTLGEADVLRRGMSGKFRSRKEFEAVEQKFISNCKKKGYTEDLIFEVWNQIKSFAGYAFAKGHSASYAVESYQSLFLKCYFPIEFMVAVLNNGGGFYSAEHYIHEAKMQGATIELPCINTSDHPNRVKGTAIYLGFGYLRNLEKLVIKRFLTERQLNGTYASLEDFIDRVTISIEQLTILVRIGCFRFTEKSKTQLLWHAIFKLNATKDNNKQPKLFKPKHKHFELPELATNAVENAFDELELLGFPVCGYFGLIDEHMSHDIIASEMCKHVKKEVIMFGNLVNTRHNKTAQGKLMRLSTFVDKQGHYFDAVHFTDTVHQYPIHGLGIYKCLGFITEKFGFCSMIISKSRKVKVLENPRVA